jgi:hypothetical protein
MRTTNLNINVIDNYFGLLKNLSIDNKLELISKLSNSMKSSKKEESSSLSSLYGAFKSKKSADELIKDIRESRTFNRKREEF